MLIISCSVCKRIKRPAIYLINVALSIFGVGDAAAYARSYDRTADQRYDALLSFSKDAEAKKIPALKMPFMYRNHINKVSGLLGAPETVKVCLLL